MEKLLYWLRACCVVDLERERSIASLFLFSLRLPRSHKAAWPCCRTVRHQSQPHSLILKALSSSLFIKNSFLPSISILSLRAGRCSPRLHHGRTCRGRQCSGHHFSSHHNLPRCPLLLQFMGHPGPGHQPREGENRNAAEQSFRP